MNVDELRRLAEWFTGLYPRLSALYNGLLSPIQHNANQPNKQPVEDQLDSLLEYLRGISFQVLSLQQLKTLSGMGVAKYLGFDGATLVESVVRIADYDPNTASARLNEAIAAILDANAGFQAYEGAIDSLRVGTDEVPGEEAGRITIRVGFQNDAAINNFSEWKSSAEDWYLIIRGVAITVGEAPEETKIVGASTGSIILVLTATAAVAALIASISREIASVAKEAIDIRLKMEELQQMKILTAGMKREFESVEKRSKAKVLKKTVAMLSKKVAGLDGGQITAFEASVKKLLEFNEKGGNVDFIAPDDDDDPDDDQNATARAALTAAREAIHEYQDMRDNIRLLEDKSKKD